MYRTTLRSLIIPAVLTVAPSSFARAECKNERGLLHGIIDVSNAHDYSRRMISNDATALLRDRKCMYNCALKDAHGDVQACKKNLDEIIQKATEFMKNQKEVWDRDELQAELKAIVTDQGALSFILGGKTSGKSLILKLLEMLSIDSVFVVDLREHRGDMLQGLLSVLDKRKRYYEAEKRSILDAAKAGQTFVHKLMKVNPIATSLIDGFIIGLTNLLDDEIATKTLSDLIQNLLKVNGGTVTIIIDEANMAFTPEKGDEAKNALALFTKLTKQDLKV